MLHRNVPVVEWLSLIRVLDRIIGISTCLVQDVGEAARDLRVMILDNVHIQNGTELREVLSQLVFCRAARDTCDVDVTIVLLFNFVALLVIDAIITS